MSDDRLTPEERAVIEAAELLTRFSDPMSSVGRLRNAVDAYRKATAPPEPFEAYVGRSYAGRTSSIYYDPTVLDWGWDQVWRVTVTPTERLK